MEEICQEKNRMGENNNKKDNLGNPIIKIK